MKSVEVQRNTSDKTVVQGYTFSAIAQKREFLFGLSTSQEYLHKYKLNSLTKEYEHHKKYRRIRSDDNRLQELKQLPNLQYGSISQLIDGYRYSVYQINSENKIMGYKVIVYNSYGLDVGNIVDCMYFVNSKNMH